MPLHVTTCGGQPAAHRSHSNTDEQMPYFSGGVSAAGEQLDQMDAITPQAKQ